MSLNFCSSSRAANKVFTKPFSCIKTEPLSHALHARSASISHFKSQKKKQRVLRCCNSSLDQRFGKVLFFTSWIRIVALNRCAAMLSDTHTHTLSLSYTRVHARARPAPPTSLPPRGSAERYRGARTHARTHARDPVKVCYTAQHCQRKGGEAGS